MPSKPETLRLEDAYRRRIGELWRAVVGSTRVVYRRTIDPEDLLTSVNDSLPRISALVYQGQVEAIRSARAYVTTVVEMEAGQPFDLADPVAGNAGTTVDGRRVFEVLAATPARMGMALKRGRTVRDVARFGEFSLTRAAHTEIVDAARQEIAGQIQASDDLRGWRWVTSGTRSCPACLSRQDGRVRSGAEQLTGHAGCDCIQEIVLERVRESVKRPTGRDLFERATREGQDLMLGEGLAEVVRKDPSLFDRLAKVEQHQEWRPSITTRPLEELVV